MPLFQTITEPALVIDPALDSNSAGNCSLLMELSANEIRILLVERKSLKVMAIERISLPFAAEKEYAEQIPASSQLIQKYPYTNVKVVLTSKEYTFVPEALFRAGDEYKFYRLNFHADLTSTVHSSQIKKYNIVCLYGLPAEFYDAIQQIFPDIKLYHFSEVLLNNRFLSAKNDHTRTVQLNVRDRLLDIIVTEGKKLILMNTFSWQTIEDVLYYTLFVSEQLGIDPEQNRLILSGEVERSSALYKLLDNYFTTISFDELPGLNTGYGLEEISFYQNSVIFGLSLCE
jgi:hypothetical protein